MRFLLALAFSPLIMSALILGVTSCSRPTGQAVTAAVVDCTIASVHAQVGELGDTLEQAIRAATSPEGRVDLAAIKSTLLKLGLADAKCLAAEVFARLLRAPALLPGPRTGEAAPGLREAWEQLRREDFAGARFKTSLGEL